MDGLWHRRLRAKPAFTFPEQATRFPPESYKPVQNLLSRMKSMRPLAVGRDATCRPNGAYLRAPVHGDLGFRLEGTTVSGG